MSDENHRIYMRFPMREGNSSARKYLELAAEYATKLPSTEYRL